MKLKVICNCISIYSANYCLPSLHNSLEWRDKTHPLTVHRLTLSTASVSLYLPLLSSIKKFTPTSRSSSVLSKFLCSSCCVFRFHKCLVYLFFYSSTTVVCILISTIPRKWVRLGFNCLFLVLHVFFSVSSSVFYFFVFRHLLSVWITLLLNQDSRFVGFGCPVSQFRKIFPSICSVSRCNVWLAYTAYCYGILFSCLFFFPLAILILYFSQDMYKYSFLFFWVIFYRFWVFANLFVISFKSIKW